MTASIQQIKQQLKETEKKDLIEICLRLARFKKDNKELLYFVLFEEYDLDSYIKTVKNEIDEGFAEMNTTNIYFAKKTLRKVLRLANKRIRLYRKQNCRSRNFNALPNKFSWR